MKKNITVLFILCVLPISILFADTTTVVDKYGNTITIIRYEDGRAVMMGMKVNTSQYGIPANQINEQTIREVIPKFFSDYAPLIELQGGDFVVDRMEKEDVKWGTRWIIDGHQEYQGISIWGTDWRVHIGGEMGEGNIGGLQLMTVFPNIVLKSTTPQISKGLAVYIALLDYEKNHPNNGSLSGGINGNINSEDNHMMKSGSVSLDDVKLTIIIPGYDHIWYTNDCRLAWSVPVPEYNYFIDAISGSNMGALSVWREESGQSTIDYHFCLCPPYPNPFNPSTNITFGIPKSDNVTIKVYDLLGREVTTLANEFMTAGYHTVNFNASGLPSGMYIVRLQAEGTNLVQKMILSK